MCGTVPVRYVLLRSFLRLHSDAGLVAVSSHPVEHELVGGSPSMATPCGNARPLPDVPRASQMRVGLRVLIVPVVHFVWRLAGARGVFAERVASQGYDRC